MGASSSARRAKEQVAQLARTYGVPATSTSFSFVNAAHALGARRVAVAATYPRDVAERFVQFLFTDDDRNV